MKILKWKNKFKIIIYFFYEISAWKSVKSVYKQEHIKGNFNGFSFFFYYYFIIMEIFI